MNELLEEKKISDLTKFGNVVPDGYKYYKKKITPGELFVLPEAYLKWYNLHPVENDIPKEEVKLTKDFIFAEAGSGHLKLENDLGFVILHRAGNHLLLLITTWRNTNEMWESVFVKDTAAKEEYKPIKFKNDHKGTYCIWELGIVWHERNSWLKFIQSNRNSESKLDYLNDLFLGTI
jgi:hypothetical protein